MPSQLLLWTNEWLAAGGWTDPTLALVAAFVFGQVLAWAYETTFHGLSYSRGFSHTIALSSTERPGRLPVGSYRQRVP